MKSRALLLVLEFPNTLCEDTSLVSRSAIVLVLLWTQADSAATESIFRNPMMSIH